MPADLFVCPRIFLVVFAVALALPSAAQETAAPPTKAGGELEFAFEGAPWRDVIKWVAESDELALHIGDLPTGSFTYSDRQKFSTQQAIDRINLFLLPQGFTLIRSGRLLSLINLTDRQSKQQLDNLARLVDAEELSELQPYEVVKCIFALGELDSEDAIEELSPLNLITTPAVFPKTNRILVIDSAEKLRSVKSILESFEPRELDNGTVVKTFVLEHVDAEDILLVLRPHLGLATGEMIGIDISLSADLEGKYIFATGVSDKVKVVENMVNAIDQPKKMLSTANGEAELKRYSVEGANAEMVFNVLQTLLAGRSEDGIRLSADEKTGNIVALAPPDVQKEIAATVEQLKADETEFAVIELKTIDPYFAITLLEEMLDVESDDSSDDEIPWWERDRWGRGRDRKQEAKIPPPKLDADPANMRLFVRGRKFQIEEIRKIVEGLDSGTVGSSESARQLRVFPLKGRQAEKILQTAAKFWRQPNPVFYYPSPDVDGTEPKEKTLDGDLTIEQILRPEEAQEASSAVLLTKLSNSQAAAIRAQLTPRGLLLQCEDTDALDEFEELLRTLTGPLDMVPSAPVVFYLKYTRASDAIQMLAELLDGGEAVKDGESGSLVNGFVSSGGSFLSSIITAREGTMTMMSGTITVVADTRLNRLIAQGTASEVETIESYLKIIDKDSSITSIETYGTSHIIELEYAKAPEVAAAITEAFAHRLSGGQSKATSSGGDNGKREDANDRKKSERGQDRPTPTQAAKDKEPKMTLTVHELSNSLIVTAPESLFREVEQLARQLDERSRQTIRVLNVPDGIPLEYLNKVLSGESGSIGSPPKSKSSKSKK